MADFSNLNVSGSAMGTIDLDSVILPDIPTFTIPKPVWSFSVKDLVLDNDGDLHSGYNRSIRFSRRGHNEASITVSSRSEDARLIDELRSDLLVYRNGDFLFRGRLGPTSETGGADAQTVQLAAHDYRAILERRTLPSEGSSTGGQEELLWNLINAHAGDLDITRDTNESGVSITAEWSEGKSLKSLFDDLAGSEDSFDWTIDQQLRYRFWQGSRGSDNEFILDFGGTVTSFNRQFNPNEFANAIRVTGDADTTTPVVLSDIGPEGRFDADFNFPDITNQAHLAKKAAKLLAEHKVRRYRYTVVVASGVWEPNRLWLGDHGRLVIRTSRMNIDQKMRVEEIDINIGDDGEERVTLTLEGL